MRQKGDLDCYSVKGKHFFLGFGETDKGPNAEPYWPSDSLTRYWKPVSPLIIQRVFETTRSSRLFLWAPRLRPSRLERKVQKYTLFLKRIFYLKKSLVIYINIKRKNSGIFVITNKEKKRNTDKKKKLQVRSCKGRLQPTPKEGDWILIPNSWGSKTLSFFLIFSLYREHFLSKS